MRKIFILHAGQSFLHAKGLFNQAVTDVTLSYFKELPEVEVQVTHIDTGYDILEEVEKYKWADLVIYHTPIWWFNIPHGLKQYFDEVLSAGRHHGLASGDGRSSADPTANYGTGGLLINKPYMVTTSMNAPVEAFTRPGDFFNGRSVDEAILLGFHHTHAYLGMVPLTGFHFYDIIKNADTAQYLQAYRLHLKKTIKNL